MKRFSIFYMTVILFCTFFVGTIYSQDKYYCRLGPQPLVKCDSIVSVKFDPMAPTPDYGSFAVQIEALDETIDPYTEESDFVIFHVLANYDIDSVVSQLQEEADVLYAFHAFKDTFNNVFTLNDAFVISYYESVSPAEIDSISVGGRCPHLPQIKGRWLNERYCFMLAH